MLPARPEELQIVNKQPSPKSETRYETTKRRKSRKTSDVNKKLKFFIKFKLDKKQYEINFKYDMERDNPQLIAQEMREML